MAERESDQEEWERKTWAKVEENQTRQERMGLPENLRKNMKENTEKPSEG